MTTKLIQKEFAAFTSDKRVKHFLVDVYSDRVTFVVGYSSMWLPLFMERRNVITDPDRGGFSISLKDAKKLELPTEVGTYKVHRDARKRWSKM
ncbi:MAG: hypothetical protein ACO3TI_07465 [Aquiluna sp.]